MGLTHALRTPMTTLIHLEEFLAHEISNQQVSNLVWYYF